jgi:hypothetical protein
LLCHLTHNVSLGEDEETKKNRAGRLTSFLDLELRLAWGAVPPAFFILMV